MRNAVYYVLRIHSQSCAHSSMTQAGSQRDVNSSKHLSHSHTRDLGKPYEEVS